TRPVLDPRNRNKDSTPKTRQKQSPIPRPTNQISWTEEEKDQDLATKFNTNRIESRNPNTSQPKGQPPLITTPPEVGYVKGKVVVLKQKIQQPNEHETRSKTSQLKSVPNKSLGSPEARANFDPSNHFTLQQERRKNEFEALVTEDKSAKRSKGNKTSAGFKKQKQGFNSDNQIEIEPDSETDKPKQLD
ncbi:MAG: hypothetical protein EZS28_043947, partial [Streblomastix strix]